MTEILPKFENKQQRDRIRTRNWEKKKMIEDNQGLQKF
jgi:hypothetical protein